MKRRPLFSKFIRPALVAMLLVAFTIESGSAIAEQIPGPGGDNFNIVISGEDYNAISFTNPLLVTISAVGLGNNLTNRSTGFLSNVGGIDFTLDAQLINEGTLQNEGTGGILLTDGAKILNQNGGGIVNYNNLWSNGFLTSIENTASLIINFDTLRNEDHATLTNRSGLLYNDGGDLIVNNSSALSNIEGSSLTNEGGGTISIDDSRLANGVGGALLVNCERSKIVLTTGSTLVSADGRLYNTDNSEIRLTGGSNMENRVGATLVNSEGSLMQFGLSAVGSPDSELDNLGTVINTGLQTKISMIAGSLTNQGSSAIFTNEEGALLRNFGNVIVNSDGATFTNTGITDTGRKTKLEILNRVGSKGSILNTGSETQLINTDWALLINNGNITNEQDATITNSYVGRLVNQGDDAKLYNYATIINGSSARILNDDSAFLKNSGAGATLLNQRGAHLDNENGASFYNEDNALIRNEEGARIVNTSSLLNMSGATIINDGLLQNGDQPSIFLQVGGSFFISETAAVEGTGTYRQVLGQTNVNGSMVQGEIRIEGGVLSGVGNVTSTNAPLYVGPGATIEPGESLGTLGIGGNLICDNGLMEIEIGLDGADLLDIFGTAEFLGGEILFSFIDDFKPQEGDLFTFISAAEIIGLDMMSFNVADAPLGIDYTLGSDGTLLASSSVPEPSTILLLLAGLGLLGMGAYIRRRRNKMN